MKIHRLALEFYWDVIATTIIAVGAMQWLVQVPHEMHDIVKGLVTALRLEPGSRQFPLEPFDSADNALIIRAIFRTIQRRRRKGDIHVVPGRGLRVLVPHLVSKVGNVRQTPVWPEDLADRR